MPTAKEPPTVPTKGHVWMCAGCNNPFVTVSRNGTRTTPAPRPQSCPRCGSTAANYQTT